MTRMAAPLLALALLCGCSATGQGDFSFLPDGDDDDTPAVANDDDAVADPWSDFQGIETLNLKYDEEAVEAGAEDCQLAFEVAAERDDAPGDVCVPCDAIWTVVMTRKDGPEGCGDELGEIPDSYTRRFGVRALDEAEFFVHRTTWSAENPWGADIDDPLIRAGQGSLSGTTFAWEARDGDARELAEAGLTLFFSGEGAM